MSKKIMTSQFMSNSTADIRRSTFNRSHQHITTLDSGYLVPVLIDEIYPGDTININPTYFTRMMTPLTPIFDSVYVDTFAFYCPARILWDNFKKMMGEQDNPDDTIDYVIPTITAPAGGYANQSIYDYLGLPTKIAGYEHSALPLRMYNRVWNDFFRDENLQDSVTVNKTDSDVDTSYVLLRRNKRPDYFTSCLPAPQKGPGVEIPLGDIQLKTGSTHDQLLKTASGHSAIGSSGLSSTSSILTTDGGTHIVLDPNGTLTTGSTTINSLRQAFQLQRFYERDQRGGTRYNEKVLSHYGVTIPDSRLQRPEFLGGSSQRVQVQQIAQTSSSVTGSPQANLAAYAQGVHTSDHIVKSFTEHGYIMILVNIRADLTYQQGLDKLWTRSSQTDFYFPVFANLGEQAVLNKEIFTQGPSVINGTTGDPYDDEVFGYQERWSELRLMKNRISGKLRSNDAVSLDYWHLSQEFTTLPTLNSTFLQENPPIDRISAVTNEPQFKMQCYFNYIHTRALPSYSIPGMIDHF